jgi:arylsulfatase A-like enzyme
MPNLVLFMADQLRADALGCYDNQFARTPALDGLAAGGARLGAHMTPNQICSPSRGTMFSGLYARHHSLVHNGITLPTDLELIPHALARAGYRRRGIDETRKLFHDPGLADIRARLTARIENEWPPASDAGGPRIATY